MPWSLREQPLASRPPPEEANASARVNSEEEQSILNGTSIKFAEVAPNPKVIASSAIPQPAATNSPDAFPQATLVATAVSEPTPVAKINPAEEQTFLASTSSRRLMVGAQAAGKLLSPAMWFEKGGEAEQFVVQLTQPLTDTNGSITLPSGTEIVATVSRVSEAGMATVSVSRLVIDGQEYLLPEGAMSFRGDNGQPLMASKSKDKSVEIASRDATTFVLGSLSKVGEVINRPDVETSTSSSGIGVSQTTISRSGNRNILGAVLEGGFEPLTQEMLRRNQQATEATMSHPDTWYIAAGQNVQLFVNRSFEL